MRSVAMYSHDKFTHPIRWLAHAVQANNNLKNADRGVRLNNIHIDIAVMSDSFRLILRLDWLQLVPM